MKYLFVLSQENLKLALQEVVNLLDIDDFELMGNYLLINGKINMKLISRLAYTKRVYRVLFESSLKNIEDDILKYNWKKEYEVSYSVRCFNELRKNERGYAKLIWQNLLRPKVDLKNAKTKIGFYKIKTKIYSCLLLYENNFDFQSRRSHLRPKTSGTSMHPKLAMACVNLTGIKKGILVDPFCGSGGIMLEAGLVGIKIYGYDIDQISLDKAKVNLKHYGVNDFKLIKNDAIKIKRKIDYLVTDLPYGKSSKISKELHSLFSDFFDNLSLILVKRAVVIFPDFIDYKKYLKKYKIENVFKEYVHKSLTKYIVVIVPKD